MSLPVVHRGEVWIADVGPKRRPVLVMTRDPMGEHLHSVICAPITSTIRGITTEVAIGIEAGLAHPSVANFDNLTLVPRSALVRRLGTASPAAVRVACAAVRRATGC